MGLKINFIRSIFQLVSGNFFAMVIPAISIPIYTRLYSPDAYAEWGIFSSFLLMTGIIQVASSDLVAVKLNKRNIDDFFLSGLSWFTYSSIVIILCLLFDYIYFNFFNFNIVEILILMLSLNAVGISNLLKGRLNFLRDYKLIAQFVIIVSLIQVFFRVFLPLIFTQEININFLLISFFLAQILGLVFLLHNSNLKLRVINIEIFKRHMFDHRELVLFQTCSKIFELGSLHIVLILLALFYNSTEIGYYTISLQLALLPAALIGGALGTIIYKEMVDSLASNIETPNVKSGVKIILIIAIVFGLIFKIGIGNLIVSFLGSDWENSLSTLITLVAMSIPLIITQPLNFVFKAYNRMKLKLLLNFCYFIFPLTILFFSMNNSLPFEYAIRNYALTMVIISNIFILIALRISGVWRSLSIKLLFLVQIFVTISLFL